MKKELALSLIILTLTAIIRLISDNELLLFCCELLDIGTLSIIFIVLLWVKKQQTYFEKTFFDQGSHGSFLLKRILGPIIFLCHFMKL